MFDFAIRAEYKIEDNNTHHKKNILKSKFGLMPQNDLLCLECATNKPISPSIPPVQQTNLSQLVLRNRLGNWTGSSATN